MKEVLNDLGLQEGISGPPIEAKTRVPILIIESGDNYGARTVLGIPSGESRQMGRPDIAGGDESISRRHFEIRHTGNHYFVRDLASKNGTMLRGLTLKPDAELQEIGDGDRLKVGDVYLRFAFLDSLL